MTTQIEKKLRKEFEAHLTMDQREMFASGKYRNPETQWAWVLWRLAYVKYASRWLPIDEAARDGRLVDLWIPVIGRVANCYFDASYGFFRVREAGMWLRSAGVPTHYMSIPDAPEMGR